VQLFDEIRLEDKNECRSPITIDRAACGTPVRCLFQLDWSHESWL